MESEREALVKRILPELSARARQRRMHVTAVDLRWGLDLHMTGADEADESTKLVTLCLNEIDRCLPLFLGILGSRYGWVPVLDPDGPFGALLAAAGPDSSVTALEIFHGAITRDKAASWAIFFAREPAFLEDITEPRQRNLVDDGDGRVAALEARIRDAGFPVTKYPAQFKGFSDDGRLLLTGLAEFEKAVTDQLWAAISRLADQSQDDGETDEERAFQDAFVESRVRFFSGREAILETLSGFARGTDGADERLLCVAGHPGSGKSAILAKVVDSLTTGDDCQVVSHFVGASPSSVDAVAMLRRLVHEVTGTEPAAEASADDLIEAFSTAMAADRDRPLVVVVDAVNQLTAAHNAHTMQWLPYDLAATNRMLLSCIPGHPCLRALESRQNLRVFEAGPLSEAERESIVAEKLSAAGKTLGTAQLGDLLSKQDAERPLFLGVACEELRVFGSYEHLNQFIHEMPGTIGGLFELVWTRLETEHGPDFVARTLSLVALAEGNLLEADLVDLLDVPARRWAALYVHLSPYLRPLDRRNASGTLEFFHQQVTEAVASRYLGDNEAAVQKLHGELAAHYRHQIQPALASAPESIYAVPVPTTAVRRLPHHLLRAGVAADYEAAICSLDYIELACSLKLTYSLVADLVEAAAQLDSPQAAAFAVFVRGDAHILQTNARLAVQQGLFQPDGSDVEAAARELVAEGKTRASLARIECTTKSTAAPRLMLTLVGHRRPVTRVLVAPDGRIVSTSLDGTIRLWDAGTGQLLLSFGASTAINDCMLVDAELVLTADSQTRLRLWSMASGSLVRTLALPVGITGRLICVDRKDDALAFGGDSHTVYVAAQGLARAEGGDGDGDEALAVQELVGHTKTLLAVQFLGADARLASCCMEKVLLWNLEDGSQIGEFAPHRRFHTRMLYAPWAEQLVTSADDSRVVVSAAAPPNELVRELAGHTYSVTSMALSEELVVTGSADMTVSVWKAGQTTPALTLRGHSDTVTDCAIIDSKARIVTCAKDKTLRVWDIAPRDGEDRGDPAENNPLEDFGTPGSRSPLTLCSLRRAGNEFLTLDSDGQARIWDVVTRRTVFSFEPLSRGNSATNAVSLLMSPDDRLCYLFSMSEGAAVYDLVARRRVRALNFGRRSGPVLSTVFLSDTILLTGSTDGRLRHVNARTGKVKRESIEHNFAIKQLVLSPDRRVVVFPSTFDICVWNPWTLERLYTLSAHTDYVRSMAFGVSGTYLLSGAEDRTVCVWTMRRDAEPVVASQNKVHVSGWCIGIVPLRDDRHVLTMGMDRTVRLHRISQESHELEELTFFTTGGALLRHLHSPTQHDGPIALTDDGGAWQLLRINGLDLGTPKVWVRPGGALECPYDGLVDTGVRDGCCTRCGRAVDVLGEVFTGGDNGAAKSCTIT